LGTNAREFNLNIKRISREMVAKFFMIQRKILLDGFGWIVVATPVDTGRARANWQITTIERSTVVLPWPEDRSRSGQAATEVIARGSKVIGSINTFTLTWFTNNVPYIIFLENGHSAQSPKGMLVETSERMKRTYPALLR